ncbi:hypothetical protein [Mycobacterium antarcticum]|uniref:hypothetical protein n=1 Tax=Mycolicibacterium sp. TUM20984 TaxID=3023368 RepID=UPI0023944A32|nr:hypothetical protein [Mycolicibacterium sp. TUM20984]GLP83599.1 hypothetical protein TUM20984_50190 [Mycolicibacterium sp. TUM20984]
MTFSPWTDRNGDPVRYCSESTTVAGVDIAVEWTQTLAGAEKVIVLGDVVLTEDQARAVAAQLCEAAERSLLHDSCMESVKLV